MKILVGWIIKLKYENTLYKLMKLKIKIVEYVKFQELSPKYKNIIKLLFIYLTKIN